MLTSYSATAYGASRPIPPRGQVDLLVAGFACVDFSTLNLNRKDLIAQGIASVLDATLDKGSEEGAVLESEQADGIDLSTMEKALALVTSEKGESSVTFRAVAIYARDFRPPLIILENILGAPWHTIRSVFDAINYDAGFVQVDTKDYYLPHTRQRGYMLCIDRNLAKDGVELIGAWAELMRQFERPASSPVEDFLLSDESPQLARALGELVEDSGADKILSDVKWPSTQLRHQRVRMGERLGVRRPYSSSGAGKTSFPLYVDGTWGRAQPERVRDSLDILKLYSCCSGEDFEFKAWVHKNSVVRQMPC